jgi:hypothetical protein
MSQAFSHRSHEWMMHAGSGAMGQGETGKRVRGDSDQAGHGGPALELQSRCGRELLQRYPNPLWQPEPRPISDWVDAALPRPLTDHITRHTVE